MSLKVSIVTVVLNGQKHLGQAMRSVLEQAYPDIEYIVIDGGSEDGSVDIIRSFHDQLTTWVSAPDKGMYYAMNRGIALATGELVGLLNSDDWYQPDAVEAVVKAALANPAAGVFHGKLNRMTATGELMFVSSSTVRTLDESMIEHPSCFVRRSVYQQHGAFDTRFRSAADYDLMLRFRQAAVPFVFVDHVLANFRAGGISENFRGIAETIRLKRRYGIIGAGRGLLLLGYMWIKQRFK